MAPAVRRSAMQVRAKRALRLPARSGGTNQPGAHILAKTGPGGLK